MLRIAGKYGRALHSGEARRAYEGLDMLLLVGPHRDETLGPKKPLQVDN